MEKRISPQGEETQKTTGKRFHYDKVRVTGCSELMRVLQAVIPVNQEAIPSHRI